MDVFPARFAPLPCCPSRTPAAVAESCRILSKARCHAECPGQCCETSRNRLPPRHLFLIIRRAPSSPARPICDLQSGERLALAGTSPAYQGPLPAALSAPPGYSILPWDSPAQSGISPESELAASEQQPSPASGPFPPVSAVRQAPRRGSGQGGARNRSSALRTAIQGVHTARWYCYPPRAATCPLRAF